MVKNLYFFFFFKHDSHKLLRLSDGPSRGSRVGWGRVELAGNSLLHSRLVHSQSFPVSEESDG